MPTWENLSFVLASEKRSMILKTLNESNHSPSQLSDTLNIPRPYISILLKELNEKKLIKCLTGDRRKGKIFSITSNGKKVLDEIKRMNKR